MKNYYVILDVLPHAHIDEIRKRFYALSKKYHPDVNPNGAERYKEITEAWNVVSDPEKRKVYDLKLTQKTFIYSGSAPAPKKQEPEFIGEFTYTATREQQKQGYISIRFPNNHRATISLRDVIDGERAYWTLARKRYCCYLTIYLEPEPEPEPEPTVMQKIWTWIKEP